MTSQDQDDYRSMVARRNRRRMQALAGAVSLAALGTAAFLVTSQVTDKPDGGGAAVSVPIARGPVAPDVMSSTSSPTPSVTVPPSASPAPRTDEEQIQTPRSPAPHATGQVRRPLLSVTTVAEADITSSVTGSTHNGGQELHLYSARQDLTGQKELAWLTGDHERVGDADCTQTIRLSRDVAARERPTLLICWHTSETKSVYTVAVKMGSRPSKVESVAAIDKEWARLG